MKIVFLEAVQDYGGAQMATVDFASRLDQFHQVSVIDCHGTCRAYVDAVNESKLPFSVICQRDSPYVIAKYSNLILTFLRAFCYIPLWLKLRFRVKKILNELSPDIVIVYNTKVLSLLQNSSKRKYKVAYYAHGWYLPWQISPILKFLLKNNVDEILCISETTRQALYGNRISSLNKLHVVHNSINELTLPSTVLNIANDSYFKLLHAGAFVEGKGIHVSVEIAKQLKLRGFKFKLVIAGLVYKSNASEDYYKKIVEMIRSYDLVDDIIIVRDQVNVIDYFRACDVLLHPSASEGLPLVLMEAMMLKKPVVANAVGGITDMILNNYTGILPGYNDVIAYVDSVIKLKNESGFYDYIANNAYNLMKETFNNSTQITEFNKVWNKCNIE